MGEENKRFEGMAQKLGRYLEQTFGKAYRQSCGHRQYGLFYEDLFIEDVQNQEALRRLPENLMQARLRRMKTASQCYATQTVLPREQWVTDEEDVQYLTPYLNEVEQEDEDRMSYWH